VPFCNLGLTCKARLSINVTLAELDLQPYVPVPSPIVVPHLTKGQYSSTLILRSRENSFMLHRRD
jgi:hypothetical protein